MRFGLSDAVDGSTHVCAKGCVDGAVANACVGREISTKRYGYISGINSQ